MNIYQPFTYLITFLPTGQRYYGVRTKRGCQPGELWFSYFTSSKAIHKLIEQHGKDSFTIEIRKTFNDAQSAILWEHRVLSRLNAAENPRWLNQNNGDRKFFNNGITMNGKKHTADARRRMAINSSGPKNPNWGGKAFTDETRRKLSEARKGYKETIEVVEAKRQRMLGENNPNYGKKFAWWNDGIHNKLVEQCPGPGWVRGRLWTAGHREKMLASRHPK